MISYGHWEHMFVDSLIEYIVGLPIVYIVECGLVDKKKGEDVV
jgi:hypothetical protein